MPVNPVPPMPTGNNLFSFGPAPGSALANYSSSVQGTPTFIGPLGVPEHYLGPQSLQYAQFPKTVAAVTNYGKGQPTQSTFAWQTPEVIQHERIHQAQALSPYYRQPSPQELAGAGFDISPKQYGDPRLETPAYNMGNPDYIFPVGPLPNWELMARLHNYEDLLDKHGATATKYATERIMPPELVRQMLNLFPPTPHAPPIEDLMQKNGAKFTK